MTFTAAVVTSACAAPLYMVYNIFCRIFIMLFCNVISCVFAQGVRNESSGTTLVSLKTSCTVVDLYVLCNLKNDVVPRPKHLC